ncbi:MAG: hypothetical protein KatS3mg021_1377 [Fimbriimonadales bacterium]|nr:MAG: hypothetical protein KatS3mg021_1377 [Fimbriimonadales bacterium]
MEHHANLISVAPRGAGNGRKGGRVEHHRRGGGWNWKPSKAMLSERTRMVAVTHVSNVLGTVNPVAEICRLGA